MAYYEQAQAGLRDRGWTLRRESSLYETEPWGGAEGGDFLNSVWEVDKRGAARDLLRDVLDVERMLGRTRSEKATARTCDLDVLLWGDEQWQQPDFVVPHPRLAERRFVLIPLCELVPDARHPVLNLTIHELLERCSDPLRVRLYTP
jgi:2-amino-4-hydroxy-6-hydroxymethyldihydropteridine diphosphokinase